MRAWLAAVLLLAGFGRVARAAPVPGDGTRVIVVVGIAGAEEFGAVFSEEARAAGRRPAPAAARPAR